MVESRGRKRPFISEGIGTKAALQAEDVPEGHLTARRYVGMWAALKDPKSVEEAPRAHCGAVTTLALKGECRRWF